MTWFEEEIALYRDDAEFKTESLLLEINEQIVNWMEEQGIRRSELAERLNVSRAAVTKLLGGNPNLTIKTLCRVAVALGLDVNVQLGLPDFSLNQVVSFGRPIDPPLVRGVSYEANESALAA